MKRIKQERLTALAVTGFVVYFLIFWRRLFIDGNVPFDGNTLRFFYPTWAIGKQLVWTYGNVLWDPYRNMGQPFLADPQSHALYPVFLLFSKLDFLAYMRVHVLFHTALMGYFAYRLVFLWTNDRAAGYFGALIMAFNGLFLARITMHHHFATMAWVPACLFALARKKTIWLGFFLALEWLAGFPSFFILTLILLIVFCFTMKTPRAALVCLGKGALLAGALAAVQWLPFLELIKESARGVLLPRENALEYSIPTGYLLKQLVFPGWKLAAETVPASLDPAVGSFFIGPVVLGLFIYGWEKGRHSEAVLSITAIAALVLSLGQHNGFYEVIPFITLFRYPANWFLVALMCIGIVAGRGFAVIKRRPLKIALFGAVAIDLLLYAVPLHAPWGNPGFFTDAEPRIHGLEELPQDGRIFHSDYFLANVSQWEMSSKQDWLLMKGVLMPSMGAALGAHEVASYHQLATRRHLDFLRRLNYSPFDSPLFDMARVEKIVTVKAEAAGKIKPDLTDCVVIKNRDLRPRAFIEPAGKAAVIRDAAANIAIEADGPGTLVVSEAFFPGWKAEIDGRENTVFPYENEFLSTSFPAGTHHVRFYYLPLSFLLGLSITLLTLLMLLVAPWRRLLNE